MITQKRLKQLVAYDPKTGLLICAASAAYEAAKQTHRPFQEVTP